MEREAWVREKWKHTAGEWRDDAHTTNTWRRVVIIGKYPHFLLAKTIRKCGSTPYTFCINYSDLASKSIELKFGRRPR